MSKKGWIIIAVTLVLLLAGGAAYYLTSSDPLGGGTATAALPPDMVTAEDMTMGDAKALVTVIEYYAQGCSVCAHFDQEVFPLLKAKYIDTGKVRYVMRLYPLFAVDGPSYKLTRCVPRENYFQAADLLFRNQPEWDSAEFPGADANAGLLKMARILGLSEQQAQECMNSSARDEAINRIAKEGQERYAINSTPSLVIDYKLVEMPQKSWAEAQAGIDAALAAKGVK